MAGSTEKATEPHNQRAINNSPQGAVGWLAALYCLRTFGLLGNAFGDASRFARAETERQAKAAAHHRRSE